MDHSKQRYPRSNASNIQQSRDSSVSSYSQHSESKPESSQYAESTTSSTTSRPYSFTPSYMGAVPSRKPAPTRPISIATGLNGHPPKGPVTKSGADATPLPTPLAKGTLLVAIAAAPHSSTITYLKTMLKKGPYYRIVVLGLANQEATLKQLKMEIWGLLGQLGIEVNVQMELLESIGEPNVEETISEVIKNGDILSGVLCSPSFTDQSAANVLECEDAEFERSFQQTVGFVRRVAKATVSLLRPSPTTWAASGLFIVTQPKELNSMASIAKAALDRLLLLLVKTNQRLTVAYADSVLIPDPPPNEPTKTPIDSYAGANNAEYEDEGTYAESPTKLWNMWALQDEMNAA